VRCDAAGVEGLRRIQDAAADRGESHGPRPANAERVLESLINAFGRNVIPIELPIGSEKNLTGVVDLVP